MTKPDELRFKCPNCEANYKLVRAEAGREGGFVLKYFLVDRPRRKAPARRFG